MQTIIIKVSFELIGMRESREGRELTYVVIMLSSPVF